MRRLVVMGLLCGCVESQQVLFAAAPPDASLPATLGGSDLSAGDNHACAVSGGALYCWGANSNGELGTAELGDRSRARRVGTDADWTQVAAGEASSCGLRGPGQVWCWGRNRYGEVGRGDFQVQLTPRRVTLSRPAVQLSVYGHTCAILDDGSLWCWGFNAEGQLGQNDGFPGADATTPLQVAAGTRWKAVSTGQGHTCGVQVDGTLWCWGRNSGGHLGLGPGSPGQVRAPEKVGSDSDWQSLSCHQEGCCGLKTAGSLWCWGGSSEAAIGERTDLSPTRVGAASDWAGVAAETFFTCATKASGALWCWGRNLEGMLGTGDAEDRYAPGPVGSAVQVAAGRFYRCERGGDGALRCNGANEHGQTGSGDFERRLVPSAVLLDE